MPLRTRLLTSYLDHGGYPSIVDLDIAGIQRARATVAPARRPFTWVTGPIERAASIQDTWFRTRDGSSRQVRVYRPSSPGPHPVVMFFHGGGFVLGTPRGYDPLCSMLACQVRAVVVSVDYRMAPEHVAPQALDDCVDATRWAGGATAELGGDPSRLAVCGDSAGGNLVAGVTHAIHDEGGPTIAHQALLYPATDCTRSFPSHREHATAPVLTEAMIRAYVQHYLGPHGIPADDPRVSPHFRADLTGLPPALVQTADLDPLRDEGLAYAARLSGAGVPVRATNYLATVHGFHSFPGATTIGAQARLELVTELSAHLGTTTPPTSTRLGPTP
jgi:acetyl esterase